MHVTARMVRATRPGSSTIARYPTPGKSTQAAPGSAPILEAEADVWVVRANAYTQAALAELTSEIALLRAELRESKLKET